MGAGSRRTKRHVELIFTFLTDDDCHVRNAACRALPFSRVGSEWVVRHAPELLYALCSHWGACQKALVQLHGPMAGVRLDHACRRATGTVVGLVAGLSVGGCCCPLVGALLARHCFLRRRARLRSAEERAGLASAAGVQMLCDRKAQRMTTKLVS